MFKVFSIIGCLSVLVACNNPPPKVTPKPTVLFATIKSRSIPITKEYIGITQSMASVDIRARVEGFLTQKNFIEGSLVKKGQLLYVIDPRPFQAQLKNAEGQLASNNALKIYQEAQYKRLKNLVAKGDVSVSSFDDTTAQFGQAKGAVETSEGQLETAKINLSYTTMYSPIEGIISHKYVDVGNLVGGAEQTLLANVVQLDPMYIQFSPSVDDYNEFLQYRKNMPFPVEATFTQNDEFVFKGKMDLINNQADVSTSTILMRSIVDNPENLLLPNVYVNVKLTLTDKHPALLIPISATIQTQEQRSVYILTKDNKVQAQIIQIAGQDEQNYIIKSGIKEGDRVIVSNLQRLKPGMEVIPKANTAVNNPKDVKNNG